MTTKTTIALLLLSSTAALAQPGADSITRSDVAPISNAVEIAIGGGYMQSVGDIAGGMSDVQDLAKSGGGAELQVGWRMTPHITLGGYATLSGYDTGSAVASTTDTAAGATFGMKADYHFLPSNRIDPWISVGQGWRGLWLGNDKKTEKYLTGFDFARLQVGVDYRITPSFALSPYAGAAATVFVGTGNEMDNSYKELDDKKVNFAFTGGLMGRFDLGGSRGR
jgi:hypothetical protein